MGNLTDKFCVVGVGETPHMRPSNQTTLQMAVVAVKNACEDAGISPRDIDGITSYQVGDSCSGMDIGHALGMHLKYQVDILGGGSSTEALIGHSIGLLEGGYCNIMMIYRTMNGRSGKRMGGQAVGGARQAMPVMGTAGFSSLNGFGTPAQMFGMSCMRYMKDFGVTSEALMHISQAHRDHALLNPKSIMKKPVTEEDYMNARWISKPFRLLDCCLETDVAACMIITSRERAYDMKQRPVFIMGGTARSLGPNPAWNYSRDEIHYVAGFWARDRMYGSAGLSGPEDIDIISSYDAFTFTALIQLEAYGFAARGEAKDYVKAGMHRIDGGGTPQNLSGGHLSEGYTHGISMCIENVRQLRGQADDACPKDKYGNHVHTYDRSQGCRQVKDAKIAACLGWGMECMSSSAILRR